MSHVESDWSINSPIEPPLSHRKYKRSERSERSVMKTGSTRLSLAHCAEKLIAEKSRSSALRVHKAYMEKLYTRYPGLEDRDYIADNGVWLVVSNK